MGLAYLYSKGVEHRDLKTLNVLLDGAAAVQGDGLWALEERVAEHGGDAVDDGGGGDAKGTPAYMAPELLEDNTFHEKRTCTRSP